jgi:hypothetical protein
MSLSEIAFEQINGNYYWGKYGAFKVIVDVSTGYINATNLCKLAESEHGKSRKFNDWSRSDFAKSLMAAVARTGFSVDNQLIVPTGLPNDLRGTYAHPKLIPHVASWASPDYAVVVSDIVNEHNVRKYRETIRVKDDVIDKLTAKVNEQSDKIDKLLNLAHNTIDEMQEVKGELVDVKDELQEKNQINTELVNEIAVVSENVIAANKMTEAIAKKLDVATEQRVPPTASRGTDELFGVFHKPGTSFYRMVRRQKRTYTGGKQKVYAGRIHHLHLRERFPERG